MKEIKLHERALFWLTMKIEAMKKHQKAKDLLNGWDKKAYANIRLMYDRADLQRDVYRYRNLAFWVGNRFSDIAARTLVSIVIQQAEKFKVEECGSQVPGVGNFFEIAKFETAKEFPHLHMEAADLIFPTYEDVVAERARDHKQIWNGLMEPPTIDHTPINTIPWC